MALNFPNSPTDGQVYTDAVTGNRYVYSSGSQRWNFSANGIDMSVSTDKPVSPQQGDLWWNSDYGKMFVYYTDTDSSQWVEASPVPDLSGSYPFSNTAANNANAYAITVGAASNNYANLTFALETEVIAAFNKANTISNSAYMLMGSLQKSTFANSTTYYFGSQPQSTLITTAGLNRVYILKPGRITGAAISQYNNAGVAGAANGVPVFIRINNTTDYLVANLVLNMASSTARYNTNTSLSISVTTGDYFEFKQTSPLWSQGAPNPTNIQYGWQVFVDE